MVIQKRTRHYGATRLYWFRCTDCGEVSIETSVANDRNAEAADHSCAAATLPPVSHQHQYPPAWHGCMDHNRNHCPECGSCDC